MIFNKQQQRGFTLIELLVSIAIFMILTSVVLSRYRTFGVNAKLVNAGEDVVLALREAQVYGVGAKRNTDTNGSPIVCGGKSSFDCSYGVYFSLATPDRFIIFADVNESATYDVGDVVVDTIILDSPITINHIDCLPSLSCSGGVLNITFKRPNPDAVIADSVFGGGYEAGRVVISDGMKQNTTTINRAGQLSLQ